MPLRYKTGQIPSIGDGVRRPTYDRHGHSSFQHGRVDSIDATYVWVRFVGDPALRHHEPHELEFTTAPDMVRAGG